MAGGRPKKPEKWIGAGMEGDRRASALQFTQIFTRSGSSSANISSCVFDSNSHQPSQEQGAVGQDGLTLSTQLRRLLHTLSDCPAPRTSPQASPWLALFSAFFYPPFLSSLRARTHAHAHVHTVDFGCIGCSAGRVPQTGRRAVHAGVKFREERNPPGVGFQQRLSICKRAGGCYVFTRVFLLLLLLFWGAGGLQLTTWCFRVCSR